MAAEGCGRPLARSPATSIRLAAVAVRQACLPASLPSPCCRLYAKFFTAVSTDFELSVRKTPLPLAQIRRKARACCIRYLEAATGSSSCLLLVACQHARSLFMELSIPPPPQSGPGAVAALQGALRPRAGRVALPPARGSSAGFLLPGLPLLPGAPMLPPLPLASLCSLGGAGAALVRCSRRRAVFQTLAGGGSALLLTADVYAASVYAASACPLRPGSGDAGPGRGARSGTHHLAGAGGAAGPGCIQPRCGHPRCTWEATGPRLARNDAPRCTPPRYIPSEASLRPHRGVPCGEPISFRSHTHLLCCSLLPCIVQPLRRPHRGILPRGNHAHTAGAAADG